MERGGVGNGARPVGASPVIGQLYSFRMKPSEAAPHPTWLVTFFTQGDLPVADFWDTLAEDVDRNLRPEAILMIVRGDRHEALVQQVKDLTAAKDEWRIPIDGLSLVVLGFDKAGRLSGVSQCGGTQLPINATDFERVQQAGLQEMFDRRNGLIRPDPLTHFVHPSGKHSQAFMRIANLMVSGPEVNFAGMCLLPHIPADLAHLWVDTSSIAPVAYAAVALRRLLEPSFETPVINSFLSWEGIRRPFKFPEERNLVLISASTSGKLARELVDKKGIDQARVVTLFSTRGASSGLVILAALNDAGLPVSGGTSAAEYTDDNCPYCAAGSRPVRFVGDQFLSDAVRYSPEVITKADAPKNLSAFMESYGLERGLGMRARTPAAAVNTYHVEAIPFFDTERFKEKLRNACRRHIAASTELIVHLDDDASAELAARVAEYATDTGARSLSASDLLAQSGTIHCEGAVLIVAGCVGSGYAVQSVSRDLRDICGDNPRTFLVGFSKHSHLERAAYLAKDLAYSGTRHPHAVVVLEDLTLPPPPPMSSWESELVLLRGALDPLNLPEESPEVRAAFERRRNHLEALASGAAHDFFWEDNHGAPLRLRQTFAFWNFPYKAADVSQGDVLSTIAAVLEAMRSGSQRKLPQSPFHQTVIAPGMFGRFNDGIIQAAILRAALPAELNYAADPTLSTEMERLLRRILSEWEGPRGEAVAEFLTAIATRRLRLAKRDLETALKLPGSPPPHLLALVERCLNEEG